jgi:hypothetical protein
LKQKATVCPCRRTSNGRLTAFVVDTAVVNKMDSPELFPRKSPQMRRAFEAPAAMPCHGARERAA